MSINLTITADSAEELRSQVNGLSLILQQGPTTGATVTTSQDENPTPAKRTRRQAESTNSTEAAPPETTAVVKEETDPTDDDAHPVTLEELRAKATSVSQAGKQPEVKALLLEFEAKSVSTLREDQRSAFLKALEAL